MARAEEPQSVHDALVTRILRQAGIEFSQIQSTPPAEVSVFSFRGDDVSAVERVGAALTEEGFNVQTIEYPLTAKPKN